jgi:hypothetical protein
LGAARGIVELIHKAIRKLRCTTGTIQKIAESLPRRGEQASAREYLVETTQGDVAEGDGGSEAPGPQSIDANQGNVLQAPASRLVGAERPRAYSDVLRACASPAGRSVKLFLQMIWTGFEAMSTDNRAHARAGLNHDLDLLKQKGMWNRDGNLVVLWKRRMIAKADIGGGITCMDFISMWMGRVGRVGGPT